MRTIPFLGLGLAFLLAGCADSGATSDDGETVNVVVLRYQVNSQSTEQREQGFLDTLTNEFPQINVLSDSLYAGATRDLALQKAENLLTRYGERIDGWFCPCEPVTVGTLRALVPKGMAGEIKVVGFDSGTEIVAALRAGEIEALVVQDPVRMGYLGVKTAVEHLQGKKVEPLISTGENLITGADMDEPKNAELLSPDLAPWLEEPGSEDDPEAKYTIAVIPKGTLHDFWKSIHAGAVKAARELKNVRIIWKGPAREDDREQQIQVVENFINTGVDAIVLAPLDKTSLVTPVLEAHKRNIPVVIIDSGLDTDDIVSYIATNNYNGGVIAARYLGNLLLGKGS